MKWKAKKVSHNLYFLKRASFSTWLYKKVIYLKTLLVRNDANTITQFNGFFLLHQFILQRYSRGGQLTGMRLLGHFAIQSMSLHSLILQGGDAFGTDASISSFRIFFFVRRALVYLQHHPWKIHHQSRLHRDRSALKRRRGSNPEQKSQISAKLS